MLPKTEETIVIDPVGMNIVNRIAPGTKFVGHIECAGGILLEGSFEGTLKVTDGPLVLMQSAVLKGDATCDGDAFLFGKIEAKGEGVHSEFTAAGAVFMAETLDATANITAGAMKTYEGAQVDGRIRTVRKDKA